MPTSSDKQEVPAVARLRDQERSIGLYDSDTGVSLYITKSVDISARCPLIRHPDRAILNFSEAKRGRIVQIVNPYPGEEFGASVHYFLDEMPDSASDTFAVFARLAREFGFTFQGFRALVLSLAPQSAPQVPKPGETQALSHTEISEDKTP